MPGKRIVPSVGCSTICQNPTASRCGSWSSDSSELTVIGGMLRRSRSGGHSGVVRGAAIRARAPGRESSCLCPERGAFCGGGGGVLGGGGWRESGGAGGEKKPRQFWSVYGRIAM